ncbi:hypothetical protein CKF54_00460 [Psittacicella hinzii]|uniref:Uncharacterized protein n=1 Tax=Psittacicella hinzii TaxID=2028575 RepID=A0A3A1Y8I3_9GAMM|nr:hypothetical protein [Psittacicella hinzii]RIY34502.1 hypothetical protein CKF54_00460 [Psittacicella hinzii]
MVDNEKSLARLRELADKFRKGKGIREGAERVITRGALRVMKYYAKLTRSRLHVLPVGTDTKQDYMRGVVGRNKIFSKSKNRLIKALDMKKSGNKFQVTGTIKTLKRVRNTKDKTMISREFVYNGFKNYHMKLKYMFKVQDQELGSFSYNYEIKLDRGFFIEKKDGKRFVMQNTPGIYFGHDYIAPWHVRTLKTGEQLTIYGAVIPIRDVYDSATKALFSGQALKGQFGVKDFEIMFKKFYGIRKK